MASTWGDPFLSAEVYIHLRCLLNQLPTVSRQFTLNEKSDSSFEQITHGSRRQVIIYSLNHVIVSYCTNLCLSFFLFLFWCSPLLNLFLFLWTCADFHSNRNLIWSAFSQKASVQFNILLIFLANIQLNCLKVHRSGLLLLFVHLFFAFCIRKAVYSERPPLESPEEGSKFSKSAEDGGHEKPRSPSKRAPLKNRLSDLPESPLSQAPLKRNDRHLIDVTNYFLEQSVCVNEAKDDITQLFSSIQVSSLDCWDWNKPPQITRLPIIFFLWSLGTETPPEATLLPDRGRGRKAWSGSVELQIYYCLLD